MFLFKGRDPVSYESDCAELCSGPLRLGMQMQRLLFVFHPRFRVCVCALSEGSVCVDYLRCVVLLGMLAGGREQREAWRKGAMKMSKTAGSFSLCRHCCPYEREEQEESIRLYSGLIHPERLERFKAFGGAETKRK